MSSFTEFNLNPTLFSPKNNMYWLFHRHKVENTVLFVGILDIYSNWKIWCKNFFLSNPEICSLSKSEINYLVSRQSDKKVHDSEKLSEASQSE